MMFRKMKRILFTAAVLAVCFVLSVIYFVQLRPDVTVAGPAIMGDGIGRLAVDFMEAVYDDVNINFLSSRGSKIYLMDAPERIIPLIKKNKGKRHQGKVLIYHDSLPTPDRKLPRCLRKLGSKTPNQIRIAYSMFESSRIPESWVEILNNQFDAVAVPDSFLVDVYQNSGVEIPIFVLPLGLHLDHFLEQPLKFSRNTPFCFVNTSVMVSRKNHIGLVRAFHQAFGDNPDVQLRMNYRYHAGSALQEVTDLIDSLNVHNMVMTGNKVSDAEYLNLLLKGDVFVTLSKGEGFSIQPREAMALGYPVIISNNTAHTTIVNAGLACGISCPTTESAHITMLRCVSGDEYVADIDEAAQALRAIYENYDQELEHAAERRAWASTYQYSELKPLYLSLIKPSKIALAEKNQITPETLFTNSTELYDKYIKLFKMDPPR